ncbi:MAG: CapA family protein [Fimbriimonas ginsengisoli]|uniref:CapA family protein n=1 Tax=Fimbriimonas ginsengisoli TaxID=1005039 RepID=A0A931LRB1_FIMGI|nr:CapA family protein [Fimbriimonas ginsengisoli]
MTALLALALAQGAGKITLAAVGDVSLTWGVQAQIARKGPGWAFEKAPMLRTADIAFGNLECALSKRKGAWKKRYTLIGRPETGEALRSSGLAVVSVANNHAFDAGADGFRDTLAALRGLGIAACGTNDDPVIIERKGLKIAFVGFGGYTEDHSGLIHRIEEQAITRAVTDARSKADLVVLAMHSGQEGVTHPTAHQRRIARVAAQAGADVVLGSHPHVWQPVEWIRAGGRRCVVAYSLGNFVFAARPGRMCETGVLEIELDKSGARAWRKIPMTIRGGRPEPGHPARPASQKHPRPFEGHGKASPTNSTPF